MIQAFKIFQVRMKKVVIKFPIVQIQPMLIQKAHREKNYQRNWQLKFKKILFHL